jgi:hypothetical protein
MGGVKAASRARHLVAVAVVVGTMIRSSTGEFAQPSATSWIVRRFCD